MVTNTGNVTLTGVTLTDDVVPSLGGCVVPTTLAPGASFTCDYTVTVVLGATVNTAAAAADQVDPVDDSATVTGVEPNLDVVKTVDKTSAQPGDVLTYTITLTNNGTADATVDVFDDISGLDPAFGTVSGVTPAATAPQLTWASQTIPADGNPYTYSFQLTLNSTGWPAGETLVKNTVVVSGTPNPCAQPDVPGVPPCGTTTTVTAASHITIDKTVNPTGMVAGTESPTAYTIVVRNTGDGTTSAPVVVTDTSMPAFFAESSITCTSDPGGVNIPAPTCDYGDLTTTGIDFGVMAPGQTITIFITGTSLPIAAGVATNVAYACPAEVGVASINDPACVKDDATIVVTESTPTPTPTLPPPTPSHPTEPPFPSFDPTPPPPPTNSPAPTPEPTPQPTLEPTPQPTQSGEVAGVTSKPNVTPPPTTTSGSAGQSGGAGLAAALMLLVSLAGIILLVTPRGRRARR